MLWADISQHTLEQGSSELNSRREARGDGEEGGEDGCSCGLAVPQEPVSPPCCCRHLRLHFSKNFNLTSPAVNYQTLKQKPNHSREPERKEMNHNLPSPKLCSAKPLGLWAVTTRWDWENKTQQKAGGAGESHPRELEKPSHNILLLPSVSHAENGPRFPCRRRGCSSVDPHPGFPKRHHHFPRRERSGHRAKEGRKGRQRPEPSVCSPQVELREKVTSTLSF